MKEIFPGDEIALKQFMLEPVVPWDDLEMFFPKAHKTRIAARKKVTMYDDPNDRRRRLISRLDLVRSAIFASRMWGVRDFSWSKIDERLEFTEHDMALLQDMYWADDLETWSQEHYGFSVLGYMERMKGR